MENKEFISFSTPVSLEKDGRTLTGLIPYGVYGSKAYGAVNQLKQGCFSKSLGNEIWALFNHDWDKRLARSSNNSLKVEDTKEGLKIEIKVPETPVGEQFLSEFKAGLIDGFSFGGPTDNMIRKDDSEFGKKSIVSFNLREVSPCYVPVFAGEIEVYSAETTEETEIKTETIIEEEKPVEIKAETEVETEKVEEKKTPMNLLKAKQALAELKS